MTNPYTRPIPPTPPRLDARPLRKRKRVWLGGSSLFVLGALIVSVGQGAEGPAEGRVVPATSPTATVTATPEPGPTVTETVKAKPAPTVTVTRTAPANAADDTTGGGTGSGSGTHSGSQGSSGSAGSTDHAGTCSIVSSSGHCYAAGQYCRNGDHGSVTTTASGARIKCTYRSNAWRWSYA